jgi:hypothetical protein
VQQPSPEAWFDLASWSVQAQSSSVQRLMGLPELALALMLVQG